MSCPPPSPPHVAPRLVAALWPTLLLLVLLMFVQLDPIGTIQSSGVLVCRTEVIANTELDFKKTLKEDIKFQSLGLLVRTPAKAPCDDTDKTTKTCEDIIQRNANVSIYPLRGDKMQSSKFGFLKIVQVPSRSKERLGQCHLPVQSGHHLEAMAVCRPEALQRHHRHPAGE